MISQNEFSNEIFGYEAMVLSLTLANITSVCGYCLFCDKGND